MEQITIHGYTFIIDTMDWYHAKDAEKTANMIAENMMKWTPEYTARIHFLALENQEDIVEFDFEELADVRQMCADCASEVLSGYQSQPTSGHNSDISAVA